MYNEALDQLQSMLDSDVDPVLTIGELAALLRDARRSDGAGNPPSNTADAPTWRAATTYAFGDVVTADPAVGRYWMCVVPGVSSATQPDWPEQLGSPAHVTRVTDGLAVEWLDVGTRWTPTYDIHAAAAAGCLLKSSKASSRFDFTTDGQTFNRSQVAAHWRHMASEYRRRGARAVSVG